MSQYQVHCFGCGESCYGQYDRKKIIQDNIGLTDSLMSHFDMLFVLLHQLDLDTNRPIAAAHVIFKVHSYNLAFGYGIASFLVYDIELDGDNDEIFDVEECMGMMDDRRKGCYHKTCLMAMQCIHNTSCLCQSLKINYVMHIKNIVECVYHAIILFLVAGTLLQLGVTGLGKIALRVNYLTIFSSPASG